MVTAMAVRTTTAMTTTGTLMLAVMVDGDGDGDEDDEVMMMTVAVDGNGDGHDGDVELLSWTSQLISASTLRISQHHATALSNKLIRGRVYPAVESSQHLATADYTHAASRHGRVESQLQVKCHFQFRQFLLVQR